MKRNQKNGASGRRLGRRAFLRGTSIAAASLALPGMRYARRANPLPPTSPDRHTLLVINERGGMDGLSFLPPFGDPDYALQRPTIGITSGTFLDSPTDYWMLPAALSPLLGAWANGDLALLPASGLLNDNKSHFVQMDNLEFGAPPPPEAHPGSITTGFVARLLLNNSFTTEPVLRGLVANKLATSSFALAPKSLAIADVENFEFPGEILMRNTVDAMHDLQDPPLSTASQNAIDAIGYLNSVDFGAPIGNYPAGVFGARFRQAAAMILHGDAPEVIEIDIGGWDTHAGQGPNGGTMYNLMNLLARALAAFYTDMAQPHPSIPGKKAGDTVTTVTCTEFGRRVAENSSEGTDHGRASCVLVLGGERVIGGIYDGGWTDLPSVTDSGGDVTVLTDYRDVFSEVFTELMQLGDPKDVYFDDYVYNRPGFIV